MNLINEIINFLNVHGRTKSGNTMAKALASACNRDYGVNLSDASSSLDRSNKKLFVRLLFIAQEPDFSNRDQDIALYWLRENKYID